MESDRFDRFARAIGRQATRRNALTLLSALGLGGTVAVTDAGANCGCHQPTDAFCMDPCPS